MPLSDRKPRFQGHCILPSRISQNRCIWGTKLLKNTKRKETTPNISNGTTFNDLEWPLSPISKSQYFSTLNISETTRDWAILIIERQQEVICGLSNGDISNDLDGPLIRFSRSRHFCSRIYLIGTKLLKNTNRKPYTIYRMVQFSVTLSDLWHGFQGHNFHKTAHLKDKVTILHKRKLYLTYGMVLCLVTLTDL